jgi:hypothetical protein
MFLPPPSGYANLAAAGISLLRKGCDPEISGKKELLQRVGW